MIEAFFILPAHLRKLSARESGNRGFAAQRYISDTITRFSEETYVPLLNKVLEKRYTVSAAFGASFFIALALAYEGHVKFYFFPQLEADTVVVNVGLPTGVPFERTQAVMAQLNEASDALGEQQGVVGTFTYAGGNQLEQFIQLPPPSERDTSTREAAEAYLDLMGDIPDAENINVSYTANQGEAILTYVFSHDNEDQLRQATAELRDYLVNFEDVFFVRDNQRGEIDELNLSLKPGAEKLGVTLADVSQQIRQAYFGEEVQRLPREFGDVKVMVRYPLEARENLDSLRRLKVRTSDGRMIALATVADIEVRRAAQRIVRRDGRQILEVYARVDVDAITDINDVVQDEFIPQLQSRYPDLEVIKGGWEEQQTEFFAEVTRLFTLAMLAILLC